MPLSWILFFLSSRNPVFLNLIFSDSYVNIRNAIFQLRELNLEKIKKYDLEDVPSYDLTINKSLLSYFLKKEDESLHKSSDPSKSHLFIKTLTTFGYDYELIKNSNIVDGKIVFPKEFIEPQLDQEYLEQKS